MTEFYALKNIESSGELIINWEKIATEKWALYYKVSDLSGQTGFAFMSVQWVANDDPIWNENTLVEVMFHGVAYFDGIRHMYFGSEQTDNYGYDNYPNINIYIEILKSIRDLEKKHCRDLYYG